MPGLRTMVAMDRKVFLCDDAKAYRQLVRAVLSASPFRVVGEACDGLDCIAKVPAADPDVILLDLNMPRLDGRGAIAALREKAPVDLRGLPAGKVRVKVVATTRSGRKLVDRRRYRTCVPRRRS